MSKTKELKFEKTATISVPVDCLDSVVDAMRGNRWCLVEIDGKPCGGGSPSNPEAEKLVEDDSFVTRQERGLILYGLRLAQIHEAQNHGIDYPLPSLEEFVGDITDDLDRADVFLRIDPLCQKINFGD